MVIDVWGGQGSKSSSHLTSVTKQCFFELASRNIHPNLVYVPSVENLADDPSRRPSLRDSALSLTAFDRAFGCAHGHSFDLMALDSNAVRGRDGRALPHFSPFPSPQTCAQWTACLTVMFFLIFRLLVRF